MRRLLFGFVLLVGLAFAYWKYGTGVIVAVLDTGVDTRIPAISERLAKKPGWNFFEDSADFSDTDGHGTKVALLILEDCGGCSILPLKLSRAGHGVTPDDLAKAIRYALGAGARILNISFGLSQGSPELEAAVADAVKRGVVLVTAAGTGVSNPFRPDPLEKVYPQAYPHVVVVGVGSAPGKPDPLQNYGAKLDVLLTADVGGSSFAAALISRRIARLRLGLSDLSGLRSLFHTPL